jgi:diguanylate cyclase (GGDEF)-like protein
MTPCISVKNHLDKTEARSACICENQRPVGIVMKHSIDASMSGKYGYSLFSNKPISRIMNASPLIVDYYLPINVVAKSAMERPDEQLFDDLIVTKSGKYFGTVSMKKIFEYTLMYEKNNAKERNPLTGLPGNPVITRVMSDAVTYNSGSCIIYVDINDFKVYNDVYGFEKGDLMIKYLADMMNETVKRNFPHTSFIGHVGGDDFVIVVEGEVNEYYSIAMAIIEQFEKDKSRFFTQEHYKKGSIKAEDRFGIVRDLSLTSIALAGLYGNLNAFEHSEALSEVLASLKKAAKKQGGSYALLEPTSEYFTRNRKLKESYSDEINTLENEYTLITEGVLHP